MNLVLHFFRGGDWEVVYIRDLLRFQIVFDFTQNRRINGQWIIDSICVQNWKAEFNMPLIAVIVVSRWKFAYQIFYFYLNAITSNVSAKYKPITTIHMAVMCLRNLCRNICRLTNVLWIIYRQPTDTQESFASIVCLHLHESITFI